MIRGARGYRSKFRGTQGVRRLEKSLIDRIPIVWWCKERVAEPVYSCVRRGKKECEGRIVRLTM